VLTEITYDTLGRVTQTTFPSTLTETYGYDRLYDLTSKTDRKGFKLQPQFLIRAAFVLPKKQIVRTDAEGLRQPFDDIKRRL
jgi:YD repeat-containing protein